MSFLGKTSLIASAGMMIAGAILFGIGALNGGVEQVQAMAENGELSIGGRNFNRFYHHSQNTRNTEMEISEVVYSEEEAYTTFEYETAADYLREGTYVIEDIAAYEDDLRKLAKKDEIKKLEIEYNDIISGEFSIFLTTGDYFYFLAESGGNSGFQVEEDTIKFSAEKATAATLYIPEDWKGEEIEISFSTGSAYIEGLKADEIDIAIGAGAMTGGCLESKELDIEVAAGSLELADIITENAEIEVGVGNVGLSGTISKNLNAECGMGYLQMNLTGKQTDHNYKATSIGNIIIGDYYNSGFRNKYEINNYADSDFEINCGLGSIEISFDE